MSECKKTCGNCAGRIESILSKDRCDMTRNTIENYSNTCNHWEPNRETEIVMQKDELKSLRQERDSLQAQVAVLSGALEEVMGELICSDCKHYIIRPPDDHDGLRYFCFLTDEETDPECYCEEWQGRRIVAPKTIAHKALSSTPSETAERVQKLVEALEGICAEFNDTETDICTTIQAMHDKAQDAISEWRRDK